jgi:Tfp pilus assembly protein PilF
MEHALEIDPDNYIAHDDLGVYFSKIGRTKDALVQYQLERELDPNFGRSTGSSTSSNSLKAPAASK